PHPDAAYEWLRGTLTAARFAALIPEAEGLDVEVHLLPNLRAVNVVVHGLLGEGVAASTRFDPQAKALGEWLRARHVDVPAAFLASCTSAAGATDVQDATGAKPGNTP
ncbi:MAG: AtuA-related protein, partial [Nocardioidaceae bacterium]